MDVSWVKLSTGFLDNRKIKQIRTLPGGDSLCLMWIFLICLAGRSNDGGCIRFTDEIPYTDEMLANEFGMDIKIIRLGLEMFQRFGMLEIIDDVMCLTGWSRYQSVDKLDEMREKNRLRVSNYRARKKLELEAAKEEKNDGEKQKKKKGEPTEEFLLAYSNYPRQEDKLLAFDRYSARIKEGYTHEQLLSAVKNYARKCKRENTEKKFIKLPSTFFGPHKPFLEYVDVEEKEQIDENANPFEEYGG